MWKTNFQKLCCNYQQLKSVVVESKYAQKRNFIFTCLLSTNSFLCNTRKGTNDKEPETPSKNVMPTEVNKPDLYFQSSDRVRYRKKYLSPIERAFGILKDDILEAFGKLKMDTKFTTLVGTPKGTGDIDAGVFPEHCDVLVIGGGAIGSSIAYHLKEKARRGLNIVIVERDIAFSESSTVLSVGGIRQQFTQPENIYLSQYGIEFLRNAKEYLTVEGRDTPDVAFNPHGYLTLASEAGMDQLAENFQLQKECGAHSILLTSLEIKQRYPWISVDGVAGGILGTEGEGWFDPWSLLLALHQKVRALGGHIVNGTVVDVELKYFHDAYVADGISTTVRKVQEVEVLLPSGEHRTITPAIVILAAGCWSGDIGRMLGIGCAESGILSVPIPVEKRKRYVYCVHAPKGPGLNCPLLIDSNGSYFRREGLSDLYLCGKSPAPGEEPSCDNLDVDYAFFNEQVWPNIARRAPGFEELKLHTAWGGFYDYNSLDQNGIVGRHPVFTNLFIATGFSGHGIQHAPGIGRAVMELVLEGDFTTINLEKLSFERVIFEQPFVEKNVY